MLLFIYTVYAVWNSYFYQLGQKVFILEKTYCLRKCFFIIRYFCKFICLPSCTAQLIQDHSMHEH